MAFAWTHRDPEFRRRAFYLVSLGNALLAGDAIKHNLLTMQQLGGWCQVIHAGSRGNERMNQARVLLNTDMDFPSLVALMVVPGLVHLQIPLSRFVLSGARC